MPLLTFSVSFGKKRTFRRLGAEVEISGGGRRFSGGFSAKATVKRTSSKNFCNFGAEAAASAAKLCFERKQRPANRSGFRGFRAKVETGRMILFGGGQKALSFF